MVVFNLIKMRKQFIFFILTYAIFIANASHHAMELTEYESSSSMSGSGTLDHNLHDCLDSRSHDYFSEQLRCENMCQHQLPTFNIEELLNTVGYVQQLMHIDQQAIAIKADVDTQLLQISNMLHNQMTPSEQFVIEDRLQTLAASFDVYYQTIQQQYQDISQTHIIDPHIEQNLYAANYLKNELHAVIDNIRLEFFNKRGDYIATPNYKKIRDHIVTYNKQYKNGYAKILPEPNHKKLHNVNQNPFNKVIRTIDTCWKLGDLKRANKLSEQFRIFKRFERSLDSLKASSDHLNALRLPKIWELSHPKWSMYERELKAYPHKFDTIVNAMQQDHNNAKALCLQAGIITPTADQLHYAHQFQQYNNDPSFIEIALQGLQNSSYFALSMKTLAERANTLEHIDKIAMHHPDNIPFLREHVNDLLLFDHDPKFILAIMQMVENPNTIMQLKDELFKRDNYIQELLNQLGHTFFSGQTEQMAYQLADAHNDMQRIELLSTLSFDHPNKLMQDAYHIFYDKVTHVPKIFEYDQSLLKRPLPSCFSTHDFTQERKLYTHILMHPIQCNEQRMQAEQCISFLHEACVPRESQGVYRDLACTVAKTYIQQSYNCTPADHKQQVELFQRAYESIQKDQTDAFAYDHKIDPCKIDAMQQLYNQTIQRSLELQARLGYVPDYYQSREQALKEFVNTPHIICTKTHTLSTQAQDMLEKHGFDSKQFTTCTGNFLQQDTNAKLVQTLNAVAYKTATTRSTQQIKKGVLECAHIGGQLNIDGKLHEAMLMADICHVAVEYLWNGLDIAFSIGKGVTDGTYIGISTELSNIFNDGSMSQAILQVDCSERSDLSAQVATETATIVAELLRFVKDTGEVAASGVAGVGDAVLGLKELTTQCIECAQLTGNYLGYLGKETILLLDAAERKDIAAFEKQSNKMQAECAQLGQAVGEFLAQIKTQRSCVNGQITKSDVKSWVRSGARMATEGVMIAHTLKGCSKIIKGVKAQLESMQVACTQLHGMKHAPVAQMREILLATQLEGSMPLNQTSCLSNKYELIKQMITPASLVSETSAAQGVNIITQPIENCAQIIAETQKITLSDGLAIAKVAGIAEATTNKYPNFNIQDVSLNKEIFQSIHAENEKHRENFKALGLNPISKNNLKHIFNNHAPEGQNAILGKKSVFNKEENLIKIALEGWEKGTFFEPNAKRCDMGRIIGKNINGDLTQCVEISLNGTGDTIRTMYPV